MRNRKVQVVLLLILVVAVAMGTLAFARGGKKPFPPKCPNWDLVCMDVWDPVTCDNGVTYSNQCYADRACATGCTEGGPQQ